MDNRRALQGVSSWFILVSGGFYCYNKGDKKELETEFFQCFK